MDKKALSLPILTSLVVGNMIGTGIYILPASLAEYGTISILSWIYTSLGAIVLALTFVHLNNRFPKTGGPYIFCKEAFGRLVGFIIAYTYWASYLISIAGIAVASISYLGYLSPIFDANNAAYQPHTVLLMEIAMVWLFTLINIMGVHTAGIVQLFLTVIKILPLLVVTLIGIFSIKLANFTLFSTSHASNFTAISSAAALTFWAFIGLESATVPAENTQGPKDIYKATMYGTLLTSFIYITSTVVLMGMIPVTQLKVSQFPFATAGTLLFGTNAAYIIAICAVLSGLGALNACVLIQGQIVFAAARDHLFPKIFTKLSKHDVPVAAQLLSSSLITILLAFTLEPTLLKQFNNIALLASLLTLLTYFVTTLSEIQFLLREKKSLWNIIYSKSLIISLLAAFYSIWMISSFDINTLVIGALLILLCIPIYIFIVQKHMNSMVR